MCGKYSGASDVHKRRILSLRPMIDAKVSRGGSNGLDIIANIALINHQVSTIQSTLFRGK